MIHLHVHSEFSVLDGFGSPYMFVERARELNQKAIAISDHGSIDGFVALHRATKEKGIKPIYGCECYIVDNIHKKERREKRGHITLLCENETGFRNLCKLLSIANLSGFYYKPRIDPKSLLELSGGLKILTGCHSSFLNFPFAEEILSELSNQMWFEIMPHKIPGQEKINKLCLDLSKKFKRPIVATNDCHYPYKRNAIGQEVLLAIQSKAKWSDPNRWRFDTNDLFLKSEEEMYQSFISQGMLTKKQISSAIEETEKIAEDICFDIEKQRVSLPKITNQPAIDFIRKCSLQFELYLERGLIPNRMVGRYKKRLEEEKRLILRKKFELYFLIVSDLVGWCKNQDILIGPGRGSVGGSLVAFIFGITTIDPIKYGLLFSRFVSEDRKDLPDIDLDFDASQRERVILYLKETYGYENIAHIASFIRMKDRAIIRDVGRVFSIPNEVVDAASKSIIDDIEGTVEIAKSELNSSHPLIRFKDKYPKEFGICLDLRGQIKALGKHAAGIIISNEPLDTAGNCVLSNRTADDSAHTANWEMNDTEHMGLMKLDVLALDTLSCLRRLQETIGEKIEFEKIEPDDKRVFDLISSGHTEGIFQYNTFPMTKLCQKMKIGSFDEMIAAVALVRPGPMQSGMTEEYIRRKKGSKWEPLHPIYEKITEKDYGCILYQEQVMRCIVELAGLPFSTAEKIRKIIGKKRDIKEFEQYKDLFISGCLERKTATKTQAETLWSGFEKHSSYSFNMAHSTAYAMIGYWCGWCMISYPAEFIAANLTTVGSENTKNNLIDAAYRAGIEIVLPEIGISDAFLWKGEKNKLIMPFIEIKGVGETTAKALEKAGNKKAVFGMVSRDNVPRSAKEKIEKIKKGNYEDIPLKIKKSIAFSKYPKLLELFGEDMFSQDKDDILSGTITPEMKVTKKTIDRKAGKLINVSAIIKKCTEENPSLPCINCKECFLVEECKKPVPATMGESNIAIIGEAPGKKEDDKGIPFFGSAGNLLWDKLSNKYDRDFFYVTNVCKCYPKNSKTPDQNSIDICSSEWLFNELKSIECRLALVFGNTGLYAMLKESGGISKYNGKTIWIDSLGLWACFCLHPAFVLRNKSKEKDFDIGIKNFTDQIGIFKENSGIIRL